MLNESSRKRTGHIGIADSTLHYIMSVSVSVSMIMSISVECECEYDYEYKCGCLSLGGWQM